MQLVQLSRLCVCISGAVNRVGVCVYIGSGKSCWCVCISGVVNRVGVCVCIGSGKSLSFWYRLEKSGTTERIFCVSVAQVQGLVSFSHMLSNLSRLEVLLHRTSFKVFVCLV